LKSVTIWSCCEKTCLSYWCRCCLSRYVHVQGALQGIVRQHHQHHHRRHHQLHLQLPLLLHPWVESEVAALGRVTVPCEGGSAWGDCAACLGTEKATSDGSKPLLPALQGCENADARARDAGGWVRASAGEVEKAAVVVVAAAAVEGMLLCGLGMLLCGPGMLPCGLGMLPCGADWGCAGGDLVPALSEPLAVVVRDPRPGGEGCWRLAHADHHGGLRARAPVGVVGEALEQVVVIVSEA